MKKVVALLAVVCCLIIQPAYPVHGMALTALALPQSGGGHSVTLSWTAPAVDATHVAATGYNVKRGTATGGPYTIIGTTAAPTVTFTDLNVSAGQKFFYVVTATCPTCAESVPSNEASVTIPLDQVGAPIGLVGSGR